VSTTDIPQPPGDTFVKRRWVPHHKAEYARECDEILLEHGAVYGTVAYRHRHQARWRAQSLIKLMVELDMHPRWELREHTECVDGGWRWSIERVPRSRHAKQPPDHLSR
jgi:hypothetical protein